MQLIARRQFGGIPDYRSGPLGRMTRVTMSWCARGVSELGARPLRRGAAPPRLVSKQPKVDVHAALPLGHERHGKVERLGSQHGGTARMRMSSAIADHPAVHAPM
eukprot:3519754-Prymnesium_polylepis.1